ncbi:flagellar hook-length control protein FliK [Henriciella sp. AS95]|uniref:flagellar hook-length control protein FliK n=1 Tax=Henriciella sp. AS95 TaxID=3135782 RepID=UPI003170F969
MPAPFPSDLLTLADAGRPTPRGRPDAISTENGSEFATALDGARAFAKHSSDDVKTEETGTAQAAAPYNLTVDWQTVPGTETETVEASPETPPPADETPRQPLPVSEEIAAIEAEVEDSALEAATPKTASDDNDPALVTAPKAGEPGDAQTEPAKPGRQIIEVAETDTKVPADVEAKVVAESAPAQHVKAAQADDTKSKSTGTTMTAAATAEATDIKAAAPQSMDAVETPKGPAPKVADAKVADGKVADGKVADAKGADAAQFAAVARDGEPLAGLEKTAHTATGNAQSAPAPFQSLIQTAPAPNTPAPILTSAALSNPAQAPANAALVAAPEEITDIVTSRLTGSDRPEKIAIQLDPPELGRVSIEFKFDSQGLQQVVVTGDTPEAMTKLRQMHSQLVQSLEQHGLSSGNMSFNQNTPQRNPHWPDGFQHAFSSSSGTESDVVVQQIVEQRGRSNVITTSGINLKL